MEPPSGAVTFFFTDIEGSTRLLRRLGERYAELMTRQRVLVRDVCGRYEGHEVDTQGDAFFVVFRSPFHAAAAAAAIQREIESEEWPDEKPRVRIGIHSGFARRTMEGYVGLDVHKAARICAAGNGGQVLLSQQTQALLGGGRNAVLAALDLGEYRLKDFPDPERLFQLVVDGTPARFPPLRAPRPSNLPVPGTGLIGRGRELNEISRLFFRRGTRLVTLTGPGGVGKTRLGLEVALRALDQVAGGAFIVTCQHLASGSEINPAVAQVLDVTTDVEGSVETGLAQRLRGKEVLLLLDNLEQIEAAGPEVMSLLAIADGLRILATSRSPLGVAAEHVVSVSGLQASVDRSSKRRRPSPAVQLFVERASARRPGWTLRTADEAAAAELCRRLDGLPLAIELATGWLPLLSVSELLARLGTGLDQGRDRPDLPPRQRTLRATIDWSFDLLSPAERRLFALLAVFRGGWELVAVEAVFAGEEGIAETLAALLDKSLVAITDRDGARRFGMLETIQAYATELFNRHPDAGSVRRKHAEWCLAFATEAAAAYAEAGHATAFDTLALDHENIRAALAYARSEDPLLLLNLASVLGDFWLDRGHIAEANAWLEIVCRHPHDLTHACAMALTHAGRVAIHRDEYERAEALLARAVEIARSLDDRRVLARALAALGWTAAQRDQSDRAVALCQEACTEARAASDPLILATALDRLAASVGQAGDRARSQELAREGAELARQLNADRLQCHFSGTLAWSACLDRRFDDAIRLSQEVVDAARRISYPHGIAGQLHTLAVAALCNGEFDVAASSITEALELSQGLGDIFFTAGCLEVVAGLAAASEADRDAAALLGAGDALLHSLEIEADWTGRELFAATLAASRNRVGEQAWRRAYEHGMTLNQEDAVGVARAAALSVFAAQTD